MEQFKEIVLTNGRTALVDSEDYRYVSAFQWYYSPTEKCEYAATYDSGITIYLHRFILDTPPNCEVDHINGNGLDCRRSNLRICTHAENRRNSRLNSNNTSGYKGVTWSVQKKRWVAQLMLNGKGYYQGAYNTPEEAAWAYDVAARELFGPFARLNGIEKPAEFVSRRGIKARLAAASTCIHGHQWSPENTYIGKNGGRICRQCHREKERTRKQRVRKEKQQ